MANAPLPLFDDPALNSSPPINSLLWDITQLRRLAPMELYALFRPENLLPRARALYEAAISDEPLPPDKRIVICGQKLRQPCQFTYLKSVPALGVFMTDQGEQFPRPMVEAVIEKIEQARADLEAARAAYPPEIVTIKSPLNAPLPALLLKLDPVARRKKGLRIASIADIVANFNPDAFGVPVATPVRTYDADGNPVSWFFGNPDSNHRVASAVLKKVNFLERVELLSSESARRRAQSMFQRNVPRTVLSIGDASRVGLNAGDPKTVAARDLIEAAGLIALHESQTRSADPSKIGIVIDHVKKLLERFDAAIVGRVLSFFNGAYTSWSAAEYDSTNNGTTAQMLGALCELVRLERAGVVHTVALHILLQRWTPGALSRESQTADVKRLKRWLPPAASTQSQHSRVRTATAILLDKCRRILDARAGVSPQQIAAWAYGIEPEEVTPEQLKCGKGYKAKMRAMLETYQHDYRTLPKTERTKLKEKVRRARVALDKMTELLDWWRAEERQAAQQEPAADVLFTR